MTDNLSRDLGDWKKRATDWTPMSYKFRQTVSDFHKSRGIDSQSGAMQASLTEPSIWRIQPGTLTYGTDIGYAEYYARWRRDNGLSELVLDSPIEKIAEQWTEYITTGRT